MQSPWKRGRKQLTVELPKYVHGSLSTFLYMVDLTSPFQVINVVLARSAVMSRSLDIVVNGITIEHPTNQQPGTDLPC